MYVHLPGIEPDPSDFNAEPFTNRPERLVNYGEQMPLLSLAFWGRYDLFIANTILCQSHNKIHYRPYTKHSILIKK